MEHDIKQIEQQEGVSTDNAITRAFNRSAIDGLPVRFRGRETYKVHEFHPFQVRKPVHIYGDGLHSSVVELQNASAGFLVDNRDPFLEHWNGSAFALHDLQICYKPGSRSSGSAPLIVYERGTENLVQAHGRIERVQFGQPDQRGMFHPEYPGPKYPQPASWVELSGVFGTEIKHCNFMGQYQGPTNLESSYLTTGVLFSSGAGMVKDISGEQFLARSMGNKVIGCDFSPGLKHAVACDSVTWIEGFEALDNKIKGAWLPFSFLAGESTQNSNSHCQIIGNHIAYFRRGATIETGGWVFVKDNSFLPLAGGDFAGTGQLHLGRAGDTYGVRQSIIKDNCFGWVTGGPETAIIAEGYTRRNIIGPNVVQHGAHFVQFDTSGENRVYE